MRLLLLGLAACLPAASTTPTTREWQWITPSCTVTMRDGDSVTRYHRDGAGHIVRGERDGRLVYRRGYDRAGNWIVEDRGGPLTYRDHDRRGWLVHGERHDNGRVLHTRMRRDAGGRLVEAIHERPDSAPGRERWTYDAHGRAIHYWYGDGDRRANEWFWTWNAEGQVAASRGLAFTDKGTTWSRARYEYAGGRLIAAHETIDSAPGDLRVKRYRYDAAGHLVERGYASEPQGEQVPLGHETSLGVSAIQYEWAGDMLVSERHGERDGSIRHRVRYERTPRGIVRTDDDGKTQRTRILDDQCGDVRISDSWDARIRVPLAGDPAERIREFDLYFAPDLFGVSLPWPAE